MTGAELLADAFGRVRGVVHQAVDGLTAEQLAFRVDPGANSIAWLVWHLTRIQDDHVADVASIDQVYVAQGWADRLKLP
ncbi:MAG TPA: DinB family protein, partial [Actinomycetota bacterium]|nr:DinB family protein [Actinomycetota bacterium]